jgi:hypothetical protein
MRSLLREVGVVLAVLSVCACDSSGSQGPAGPPADRSKMYCREASAVLNLSTENATVSITCDSTTDMPWGGGCWSGPLPSGVYLSNDQPSGWDDITVRPGWTCTWAAYDVAPDANFGGHAEICCFAIGNTP